MTMFLIGLFIFGLSTILTGVLLPSKRTTEKDKKNLIYTGIGILLTCALLFLYSELMIDEVEVVQYLTVLTKEV